MSYVRWYFLMYNGSSPSRGPSATAQRWDRRSLHGREVEDIPFEGSLPAEELDNHDVMLDSVDELAESSAELSLFDQGARTIATYGESAPTRQLPRL